MKKKIWQRVAAVSMSALIVASSIPLSGSAAYAADRVKNLTISDSGNDIIINSDGNYHISGTTTKHTVIVNDSVTATITLNGANITSSTTAPILIGKDASVKLLLSGINTLTNSRQVELRSKDSYDLCALQTSDGTSLTISSFNGDNSVSGSLTAVGCSYGAGIGYRSTDSTKSSKITVSGGTINTTAANNYSSGILGGSINITGGNITAVGKLASGIVSANKSKNDTITINGGTVTARGSDTGSGIENNCPIIINGGTVTASSGESFGCGCGIGGNHPSCPITINGGIVSANSDNYGAAIGGIGGEPGSEKGKDAPVITITGGTIKASARCSAGIGGGTGYSFYTDVREGSSPDSRQQTADRTGGSSNEIIISGGCVTTSGAYTGIGCGGGGSFSWQYWDGIGHWGGDQNRYPTGKTGTVTISGGAVTCNGAYGIGYNQKVLSLIKNGVVFLTKNQTADNTFIDTPCGVAFFGTAGEVYGTPSIAENTSIPAGDTLTVAKDKILNLSQDAILTNNGTITIYGTITNHGAVRNKGQIGTISGGSISNKKNADASKGIVQCAAALHRNDGSSPDLVDGDYWLTSGEPYSASLPELTRNNYVLVGWKDENGNEMSNNDIADGYDPVTLYAQWAQVGKINAKVTDSDNGQSVSGAVIAATNESGAEIGQATTGADGIALLTLKPGTYTATVKTPATGYAASTAVSGLSVEIGKTINASFTARPFKGSAAITHLDTKRNKLIAIAPISATDKNGKVVYTGSSASTSLTVQNLRVPDAPFTIKETAALTDYRADTAAYTVNLTADGQTANVEMHSVPMMGDITYTAADKDGKPIAGATVNLVDKDGNIVATGTTDSNGKVTFKDVFTGDYTVQLPGYENGNVAVTVKDQQDTAPAPVKAAMLVGTLEITHVDAQSGKALPVAKVQLKDKSGKEIFSGAPADSGTSLTIPNLTGPASPYTLTEETPITNYHANTTQYPVSITTQGQAVKVVMKSSQYAGDVTLHITDPTTGKPASDVKVNLIDKDGNIAATGKTDKDGNVTFTNVPIGTYTYAVDDPRFKLDGEKVKSVTVTDGSKQTVSMPVISLGNVTLHITDPSTGKPASGVTVNLIDKDGKVVATGKTDENGNVTFSGIPAGDYTYKVDDPRFVSVTGKVTIGTGNTAGTIDIEVKHPASSPTVSTGSANITATDSSGKPLSNVPIIIKDSTGKTVGTGTTDTKGNVIVPNLPDGTYTVSSGDSSVSLEGSITITNGQTSSVSLKGARRVPTGNAKLLVVDTRQQPLKNFTLLVMRVDSSAPSSSAIPLRQSGTIANSASSENNHVVAEVTTDANGYVILPQLDAGQYLLISKDSAEYKVDSSIAIVPSTTVSATVTATPVKPAAPIKPSSSDKSSSKPAPTGKHTKVTRKTISSNTQTEKTTNTKSYTAPKTGQDAALLFLTVVLLAGCGTAAAVIIGKNKRKGRKEK